ncbi:LrgB family protein [Allomuricauda ruestringensis DSM 13258]|uniref:LrgB family protein n=1 Tax=Allomuricauda ruestringensis (strain DSM 13258 / CIP 107369 / LMG 19739 / B1) TaxID=886377 RepID=G2PS05_ALLRU|nr:LrgB family protein [Allomuricauda ruestringensis]AEM69595.1 LrgB family protein [Allomuricauda ruestringensis DSM 13258]
MKEYFLTLPLVWVFLTLAVYFFAQKVHRKLKWALATPIFITVLVLILLLLALDINFETYDKGGQYISFFLGPSVVALGVLFHEKYDEIKSNLIPFFTAVTIGGVSSIFIVLLSLIWLESPGFIVRSLAAKSVTTPIAIEITKLVSGIPAITAAVVIAVGIFGNAFGIHILRIFGIKSETAIGTALGTASHGIGTARALDIGRSAAAYGGLAICINGVATAILTPLILDWFSFL